jgi:glycosyltransferase involved in cell wall biosynthesis
VIDAAKSLLRRPVRHVRTAIRLSCEAWERRVEFGWRGIAMRVLRRLTGTRALGPHEVVENSGAYPMPGHGAEFDVIYAIGFGHGLPKRYRVFDMADGLTAAGYRVHVVDLDRLDDIRRNRWRAKAFVFFRAEYDRLAGVREMLAYARETGMRLVYDIDDLVFDPAFADHIDSVCRMLPYERRHYLDAMRRRRELLLRCDLVTVSTPPLARIAESLGRPAAVIPNPINDEQMRLAAALATAPLGHREGILIGYFSGSPTHQRDFAECEPALLDIIARHPEIRFRFVGYLDLGPRWDRYRDRVERIGYLGTAELLRVVAETDINLAPLEIGNPFCESKSEVKFFQTALVGVPTVASATEPFRAAIQDGVTGFLVCNTEDWRRALERLIASDSRRKAIGAAAKAAALARFSLAAVIPHAVAALGLRHMTPAVAAPLRPADAAAPLPAADPVPGGAESLPER